jgi:hypothetical protein
MIQSISQKMKDDMVLFGYVNGVFLDGKPAGIYGRLNRFATVAEIDGPLAVEFSWQAVKRIVDNDQKFSTERFQ